MLHGYHLKKNSQPFLKKNSSNTFRIFSQIQLLFKGIKKFKLGSFKTISLCSYQSSKFKVMLDDH